METVEQDLTEFQRDGLPAHDFVGQQQKQQRSDTLDLRPHPKPTPLQVSGTISTPAVDVSHNTRNPTSPTAKRAFGDSQYSPRSPHFNKIAPPGQPSSPQRGRTGSGNIMLTGGGVGDNDGPSMRKNTASPPKVQSFSQLRNVSSPFPQPTPLGNSSPPSPRSTTSPPPLAISARTEAQPMPRNSSIDSAISTISLGNLHSHKLSQDSASGMPDISNLIHTAGSPEAVIQHLLREKQHSAAQNDQLWKLVDKQRSLVLGLNQDLEKALKDKERYRKKLKEHLERVPPVPTATPRASVARASATSRSPTPSEASADLPIQRPSLERLTAPGPQEPPVNSEPTTALTNKNQILPLSSTTKGLENVEDNWVRNKPRTQDTKHSHKATSSSDVGVFAPTRPAPSVTPIQTSGLVKSAENEKLESPSQVSPNTRSVVSPSASFTAKRSLPYAAKPFHGPLLALGESKPKIDFERMTPPRKAPPAPLDLGQPKGETPTESQFRPEDNSGSDYDVDMEVDELPALERGRKKTREDDDKDREAALFRGKQDRSRSKKDKSSKSRTSSAKSTSKERGKVVQPQSVPFTPSIKSFSPDVTTAGASNYLSPPTSLASMLSPPDNKDDNGTTERVLSAKPMSPGLPLSPRPNHRPGNPPTPRMPRNGIGSSVTSPPLTPKNAFIGLPLSPRAPRQDIPPPPYTPMSLASPRALNADARSEGMVPLEEPTSPLKSPLRSLHTDFGGPTAGQRADVRPRGIFRGFVSEAYPDLLLPPNALPSILVKVVSSRLKPSRHSLVIKGSDEEPVFTLGISARSDRQALWQVEKPIHSLQQLDQQLRQSSAVTVKQPDRALFSGHAPAKIDARRVALEMYFEMLLDTPMDERTALTMCHYLSTQVSEPTGEESNSTAPAQHSGSPVTHGPDGKLLKEGYLTKRGKNFGGWKARYFVLDEPALRYYETPGGSLLGTIKLQSAQIGKQNNKSSHSPSRGEEPDGLYRHAFLIREPKRKDSNSFVDHVLCAESDVERDAWVEALLCYVEVLGGEVVSRPQLFKNDSGSHSIMAPSKKNSLKKEALSADSPDSENFDHLQAVPYEKTQAAQAPLVQITPDQRPTESPSPTTSGSQPSVRAPSAQSKAISAPQNGAKISDVGAWGNKPMAPPMNHAKEQRKRSLWGFRDKNAGDLGVNHSNDSNLSLTQQQYQEQITNVKAAFGATLAEAVELCGPRGIDACLPAVVYRCLEFLELKGAASEEGIFRMSGSNTLIKHLRGRFNAEGDFDLLGDEEMYYDVHAVASLLKLYLRELPQPVLTRELHLQFISVLDLSDKPKKIIAYNVLVYKLPKPNFTLLRALSSFLISIINNSEVNKMNIRNVGIVFSPTLNIPAPVFSMFLTDFDAIFGKAPADTAIPSLEATVNEPLTPEDIRSPRRQMFSDIPTPSYTQDTFSKSVQFSTANQQNPTYEQVLHDSHVDQDTGFVPLQPTYTSPSAQQDSMTVPGPEYAVARPRNLAPGGAAKARRRESSMLLMDAGQNKSSMPMMRGYSADMLNE